MSRTAQAERNDFDETLLLSMEQAVTALLGEQVLESLFFNMKTHQGLSREEIPYRLEAFFPALEKAFGPISGKTIGRFIVKVLYARLGLEFVQKSNCGPLEYVEYARRELGKEN